VVPHLTAAYGEDAGALDAIEADVAGRLPVAARVTAARLWGYEGGRWVERVAFPLGA